MGHSELFPIQGHPEARLKAWQRLTMTQQDGLIGTKNEHTRETGPRETSDEMRQNMLVPCRGKTNKQISKQQQKETQKGGDTGDLYYPCQPQENFPKQNSKHLEFESHTQQ